MSVNVTPVEAKMCISTHESAHFVFNLCPIYIHDGASAKFSTNSQETAYSAEAGVLKKLSLAGIAKLSRLKYS